MIWALASSHSCSAEGFPFQRGRSIVFTNAKVTERRDVGRADSAANVFSLLPTQFLALRLDTASNPLDKVFSSESIGLGRLDQFVAMQDPMVLQQLIVKVKVPTTVVALSLRQQQCRELSTLSLLDGRSWTSALFARARRLSTFIDKFCFSEKPGATPSELARRAPSTASRRHPM